MTSRDRSALPPRASATGEGAEPRGAANPPATMTPQSAMTMPPSTAEIAASFRASSRPRGKGLLDRMGVAPARTRASLCSVAVEAAFFDLDKTVIARASMVAFGRPFYRHGLISRRLLMRGLWGQLVYLYLGADEDRVARMRESVLALTKGWQQTQVRRIVREALTEVVTPIIYAEALELIEEHRAAGRRVFIVSASPEEIVEPLADHLDVDEAIASRARLDDDGCYTGEMEFYAYG